MNSQSQLVNCPAEQLIYSEVKESDSRSDNSGATIGWMHLYLWVYEADMQLSKTVYRSNMTWPNKQHEDVYICKGMAGRESADTRCLSENMTVIFTENFSKDHLKTTEGTQIQLPIRMFNKFLTQEELGISWSGSACRTNFCNNACNNKKTAILLVCIFGGIFIGLPLLVIMLLFIYVFIRDCCCYSCFGRVSNSDDSAASGHPDHGETSSPSLDTKTVPIWMCCLWELDLVSLGICNRLVIFIAIIAQFNAKSAPNASSALPIMYDYLFWNWQRNIQL